MMEMEMERPVDAGSTNVRYFLAKKQMEGLFLKWVSMPSSTKLIQQLVGEIQKPEGAVLNAPSPVFQVKRQVTPTSPGHASLVQQKSPSTPPRSPSGAPFASKSPKKFQLEPQSLPILSPHKYAVAESQRSVERFYFPEGRPVPEETRLKESSLLREVFDAAPGNEAAEDEIMILTTELCGLPKMFNKILFQRVDARKSGKISKAQFMKYYTSELQKHEVGRRIFKLIAKPSAKYIMKDDFRPIVEWLLECHPGLEFLKATPEFQDKYADTVIHRAFYTADRNDDGKLSYREFKKSQLKDALQKVCEDEDINKSKEFFAYEHFYVLYCKFWELDADHDFIINKEEFSKYEGHALSKKVVERIFDQVPRQFKTKKKDQMGYEDFIWFMLSEEDKCTARSIEYWFSIVDIDGNGVIGPYEMEYFYEEQVHRLESLNREPILFKDILCQMNDVFVPEKEGNFTIEVLNRKKEFASIFFNSLVNLNKFIDYEQRDVFAIKHEVNENPSYSDWDRFAQNEYMRLAYEEENHEDSDVFDANDPWDEDMDEAAKEADNAAPAKEAKQPSHPDAN